MDERLDMALPLVVRVLGHEGYGEIRKLVAQRIVDPIPVASREVEQYATDALDVNDTIVCRMNSLTPKEFESVLRPAFKENEIVIVIAGAVLGALVGELQVFSCSEGFEQGPPSPPVGLLSSNRPRCQAGKSQIPGIPHQSVNQRTKVAKSARALRSPAARQPSILPPPDVEEAEQGVDRSASADTARAGIRLGFLIHDVSRLRRKAFDQLMRPLAVTGAQWWVLAHLSRHDGMTQTQLAELLEVGMSSLGDVVEDLERGGWVERRPDPLDQRAKRVYLTRPAGGLIQRMTLLESTFNARILEDLDASERAALARSLSKIKRALTGFKATGNLTVANV